MFKSKRQNSREIEGNNSRQFMAELLKEIDAEALAISTTTEFDSAHHNVRLNPCQGSPPVIERFHHYTDKEREFS